MDDTGFLPAGYRLEETDADAVVLRRGDGSFVAAFSAQGATEESIRAAAEEDRPREERRSARPPRPRRTGATPTSGNAPSRP